MTVGLPTRHILDEFGFRYISHLRSRGPEWDSVCEHSNLFNYHVIHVCRRGQFVLIVELTDVLAGSVVKRSGGEHMNNMIMIRDRLIYAENKVQDFKMTP